jgi:hypothetical protein
VLTDAPVPVRKLCPHPFPVDLGAIPRLGITTRAALRDALASLPLERSSAVGDGPSTLADYGAMFFSDCLAGGSGFDLNLSGYGTSQP